MKFAAAIFALTVSCASAAVLRTPEKSVVTVRDEDTWAPIKPLKRVELNDKKNGIKKRLFYNDDVVGAAEEYEKKDDHSHFFMRRAVSRSIGKNENPVDVAVQAAVALGPEMEETVLSEMKTIEDGYVTPPTEYLVEEPVSDTEEK